MEMLVGMARIRYVSYVLMTDAMTTTESNLS